VGALLLLFLAVMTFAGIHAGLTATPPVHPLGDWVWFTFLALPVGLGMWLFGFYARLVVDGRGILVVNMLSSASIPWERLQGADGSGVTFRLGTDRWSQGVRAIAKPNWYNFTGRESGAEAIAAALMVIAEAHRTPVYGETPLAHRRFVAPWPEMAVWFALSALSFWVIVR